MFTRHPGLEIIDKDRFWNISKGKEPNPTNATIVIFEHCDDYTPLSGVERMTFPKCKLAIFYFCDKNFNFYQLNKRLLPNVDEIWFSGSMAEYHVYERFPEHVWRIHEDARYFPSQWKRFTDKEWKAKVTQYWTPKPFSW
jgi:hypothetical protein